MKCAERCQNVHDGVELLTVQLERCQKQPVEIQKRERSLAARQRTWQQCPETVTLCDISSPMQASASQRSVQRADALQRKMTELIQEQRGADRATH